MDLEAYAEAYRHELGVSVIPAALAAVHHVVHPRFQEGLAPTRQHEVQPDSGVQADAVVGVNVLRLRVVVADAAYQVGTHTRARQGECNVGRGRERPEAAYRALTAELVPRHFGTEADCRARGAHLDGDDTVEASVVRLIQGARGHVGAHGQSESLTVGGSRPHGECCYSENDQSGIHFHLAYGV